MSKIFSKFDLRHISCTFGFVMNKRFYIIIIVLFTVVMSGIAQKKSIPDDTLRVIQILKSNSENAPRPREKTDNLNKIAEIYRKYNHYETAIEFYSKSLEINKTVLNSENAIAGIHKEIGNIYVDGGNYEKALVHHTEYLNYEKKQRRNSENIVTGVTFVATDLNKLNKSAEAVKIINDIAIPAANGSGNKSLIRSCYGLLAETYELQGNEEQKKQAYTIYLTFVNEETNEAKTAALLAEYAKLKKEKELETTQSNLQKTEDSLVKTEKQVVELNERERELMETLTKQQMSLRIIQQENDIKELENAKLNEQKKRQRVALILVSLLAIVIAVSAVFLYKLFRDKKRANYLLLEKNEEIFQQKEEILAQRDELDNVNKTLSHKNKMITDSLTYAKMIQDAMINRQQDLTELIPESFIVFNPRDIVSGDFYWYEKIGTKTIVIAADCTGHGVPGAFLTFIGNSLLNQIVVHERITDPAQILTRIDAGFAEALNQEHSDNTDGMDIAICVFDEETSKLAYGGAKNSLMKFYGDDFEEVNADKSSIGGFEIKRRNLQKDFTTKYIDVKPNMWFYIFSDGIVDQFDRRSKRKYSKSRLKELLFRAQYLPTEKQKCVITQDISDWRGSDKQTDDIIIIGFCPIPKV